MRKLAPLLLSLLAACEMPRAAAVARASIEIEDDTQHAFSQPIPGLDAGERARFFVGNSFFNQNWVSAPSPLGTRDGLGPLFNARSCSGCHFKDGRGRAPEAGEPLRSMLVRISAGGRPDPHYGDQLQTDAVSGLAPEVDLSVHYSERRGAFADGEPYSLRVPSLHMAANHGPLADGLQTSSRVAPQLIGLGLLEAIAERDLLARVDPGDRDRDGISGRANEVPSASLRRATLGRFGWKAEQATVLDQTAAAFAGDMGLTSRLFPDESCAHEACAGQASGGSPELTDRVLDDVVLYARTLAVPARRQQAEPRVQRGEKLFASSGCASCHVPSWRTRDDAQPAQLASRTIHPYTDLLLHDLGEGLSDQRASFAASGAEWRTPPLWGIGLIQRVNGHTSFLHDGRARNLSEAVLWHDGEAARAKQAFVDMPRADREALLAFLESL